MIDVSAALILQNNSVFVARRKPEKDHGGYWEFPGGKVEPGETPQESLVREMWEEFAVTIQAGDIFHTATHDGGKTPIRLIGILAEYISGEFTLTDHDAWEWVPVKDLLTIRLAPADIEIAQALQAVYTHK